MRSRNLIFILPVLLAVTILGVLLFTLEGGFRGKGQGISVGLTPLLWLVVFVVPLVLLVSLLGYAMVFPELTEKKLKEKPSSMPTIEKGESALEAVLRVLNMGERKVVETLVGEGGTMLQKDIRWKTGFSRVKTHRILFRLANRGIVSAEKYYNTNKIALADWLTKEKKP